MEFILGILVGIVATLAFSTWLYYDGKKKERMEKAEWLAKVKQSNPYDYWWKDEVRGIYDPYGLINRKPPYLTSELERQLNEALAREDFKEAARIRDIMNKQ